MKKTALIIICSLVLASCEMITIGSRRNAPRFYDLNQKTPVGLILLFKIDLDSNNIPAASQLIAHQEGSRLLAIEKYDMYDDIWLLQRIIQFKDITKIQLDTLSKVMQRIEIEFNYTRCVTFKTKQIQDYWYIVGYDFEKFAISR